jgi:hypothetical protein
MVKTYHAWNRMLDSRSQDLAGSEGALASRRKKNPSLLSRAELREALEKIEPQMVLESILSREWGNWDEHARWRVGRRELAANLDEKLSGVDWARLTEAEQDFFLHEANLPGQRPGQPPVEVDKDKTNETKSMLEVLHSLASQRSVMERSWDVLNTEKRRWRLRRAGIRFLESISAIGRIDIQGQPSSPDDSNMEFASRDNTARIRVLIEGDLRNSLDALRQSRWSWLRRALGAPPAADPLDHLPVWLSGPWREGVKLARQRCEMQRHALLNQLSRLWQKPDFVVRRDAAGPEKDRLFSLAQSWDEDWYAGPELTDPEMDNRFPSLPRADELPAERRARSPA